MRRRGICVVLLVAALRAAAGLRMGADPQNETQIRAFSYML